MIDRLEQATLAHRQGRLQDAERLYREHLIVQPQNFDALHQLGILKMQLASFDEAWRLIERALAENPHSGKAWSNLGSVQLSLQKPDEALASYDRAIALEPDEPDFQFNRANVLLKLARFAEALACLDRLAPSHPDDPELQSNRAAALLGLGRSEEALRCCAQALAVAPQFWGALAHQGRAFLELGRFEEALAAYDRLVAGVPRHAEAWSSRGRALSQLGRAEEALVSLDKAVALAPNDAVVLNNRGNVLKSLERHGEALESFDRAIALQPDYAAAHNNRGNVLLNLRRSAEALQSFDQAVVLAPDHPDPHVNRGNALGASERFQEALASYDEAIRLRPNHAEAHNNRGNMLRRLGRAGEALASYEKALAINSAYVDAHYNRGVVLWEEKRIREAITSYDKAIALRSDHVDAHNNRGNALQDLQRFEEALASFDKALGIKPDYAGAHYNRGNVLADLKRFDEARESFAKAARLDPQSARGLSNWAFWAGRTCDWPELEKAKVDLLARCQLPDFDGGSLPVLFLSNDPALQQVAAQCCAANNIHAPLAASLAVTLRQRVGRSGRVRVGYLSADFKEHPVSHLTAELYELHDRSQFEVYAFSAGPDDGSRIRSRLKSAFDVFVDVQSLSDIALDRAIREAEIDIAVDLGGYTTASRILALSQRPAPLQLSYIGYPGSVGASFIDYAIVDEFVVPQNESGHFTECLARLPDCFQANDRKRFVSERTPTRAECRLPEKAFVFCSFNNVYKLNPTMFDIWMRLLHAVPGSVLWIAADNEWARRNLQREAEARGIAPSRLVFAPGMEYPQHLARTRLGDLFLDSWPYNAGTTASDALWVGLPVLTYAGRSFASRMAGSLLQAVGLPELITYSPEAYEALALKLATEPGLLAGIRQKLAANTKTAPLFDTERFCKHLEAAYRTMWDRHLRGEPPASFTVKPS